jgi:predicted protein tyrosine phosphatase
MVNLGKVFAMAQFEAEDINPQATWAMISITGTDDPPASLKHTPNHLLRVLFDDVDAPAKSVQEFTVEHANAIWDFVEEKLDGVEVFIVHCLFGACRSPGVAAAICKVKFGEDNVWFEKATPNRLVYRTMLEVAFNRGLYQLRG